MWFTSLDRRNSLVSDNMSRMNPIFVPFWEGRYTFATWRMKQVVSIHTLLCYVPVEVLFGAEAREEFLWFLEFLIGNLHTLYIWGRY